MKKFNLYKVYLLSPTNIHISLKPHPLLIPPIQRVTNPLAESFSSKLLVCVMGVPLAQENLVFSLIVTSLWIKYINLNFER